MKTIKNLKADLEIEIIRSYFRHLRESGIKIKLKCYSCKKELRLTKKVRLIYVERHKCKYLICNSCYKNNRKEVLIERIIENVKNSKMYEVEITETKEDLGTNYSEYYTLKRQKQ